MNDPETLTEFEPKEIPLSNRDIAFIGANQGNALDIEWSREGKSTVRAKNRVGTIVLPERRIIIRPKIEKVNFFHMLAESYELLDFGLRSFLYEKEPEIHEAIIEIFLQKLLSLIRSGLSKDYFTEEANLPFLRGRWLPLEDKTRNPPPRTRIYCRFPEFSHDTPENQILQLALNQLRESEIETLALRQMTMHLSRYFEGISSITRFQVPTVEYTRLNEHYRPIVNSALFIIENSTINPENWGENAYYSFLVNLERLFERFLRNKLRKTALQHGLDVVGGERQTGNWYLLEPRRFRLNPDIVVKKQGKPLVILDAKYKKITSYQDIEQGDVYEVVSYCVSIGAKLAALVYPQQEGFSFDGIPEQVHGVDVKLAFYSIPLYERDQSKFEQGISDFNDYVVGLAKQAL